MNRWLRVVLPGWWAWLLGVLLVRGFVLCMDLMTLRWEGNRELVGRGGYLMMCVAAALYGIYRVAGFHPGCRPGYLGWLKMTCWRYPLPLPLGPVHWVAQDAVVVGVLVGLEYAAGRLSLPSVFPPLGIAMVFGIFNLAVLGLWLRITNQVDVSYAVGVGISLSLWFSSIVIGLAVLGITHLVALVGLRRSLAEFPWESPSHDKLRQAFNVNNAEQRIAGAESLGWPFGHFLKIDSGPMSYRECVWLSLLLGWWFAVAAVRLHEGEAWPVMLLAMSISHGFTFARLLIYCLRFTPPISFFGRVFTGRWIIPSYDKVLIAPALSIVASLTIAGAMGALFHKPMSARVWPPMIEFLVALPLVTGLLIVFCVGPSLRNWQLTGGYRMRRGMPQGPEVRVG